MRSAYLHVFCAEENFLTFLWVPPVVAVWKATVVYPRIGITGVVIRYQIGNQYGNCLEGRSGLSWCQEQTSVNFGKFWVVYPVCLYQFVSVLLSFLFLKKSSQPVQDWEDSHVAVAVKWERIGEKYAIVCLENV